MEQSYLEQFKVILDKLYALESAKQSNYGNSYGKTIDELGLIAGLVPLHYKLDRLTNLIKENKAGSFESIQDTCIDMANYAIMFMIEYQKKLDEKK